MSKDIVAQFAEIVGETNVLTADADTAPYLKEWRGRWTGKTAAVLRPRLHRRGLRHPQARLEDEDRDRPAGRQYRACRRADPGQERQAGHPVDRAA